MASGIGISIKTEHTSKFGDICKALDAANISHSVWNGFDLLDEDYNGPIDLDCDDMSLWDDFERIVNSFIKPQSNDNKRADIFEDYTGPNPNGKYPCEEEGGPCGCPKCNPR